MPEKSTTDPISISRKGSKSSLAPKRRSGSVASSRRSNKEKASSGLASNHEKVDEQNNTSIRPKKKGGFLSFLNCCSPPENAKTVELNDQAVPAKKTQASQQKAGRQPTPVMNANPGAGNPDTGESKEAAEEAAGTTGYPDTKAANKLTMKTRSSREKVTTEKVGPPAPLIEPPETVESPPPAAYRDPPLPPVPSSKSASTDVKDVKDEQGIPTQAAAIVAPPQLIEPEESVSQQGTTINDRTPQQEQRDSDLVMAESPQTVPTIDESPNAARELQQAQINLPPPPPRNGNGLASSSSATTPNEKQQWLLPPLQPQLKGRKCLVLDLDETLVHSSFKVCNTAIHIMFC